MFGESRTRLAPGLDKGFLMDVGPERVGEPGLCALVEVTDARTVALARGGPTPVRRAEKAIGSLLCSDAWRKALRAAPSAVSSARLASWRSRNFLLFSLRMSAAISPAASGHPIGSRLAPNCRLLAPLMWAATYLPGRAAGRTGRADRAALSPSMTWFGFGVPSGLRSRRCCQLDWGC
jgi:hypothetical protein